jgi:hypothetical protein
MSIKAKLIKRKDIRISKVMEAHSAEGEVLEGHFFDWPQLGYSFLFYKRSKTKWGSPVTTTAVEEIIDYRNFRTKNSIYEIITLIDERDEKIEELLK